MKILRYCLLSILGAVFFTAALFFAGPAVLFFAFALLCAFAAAGLWFHA